jgi:aspartate/methionine/tyrosine aminotransferase
MKKFADRTQYFATSIFAKMSQKARQVGAINLSQGFPDFDGPQFIKDAASNYIAQGHNQYSMYPGVEPLRQNISNYFQNFYNLSYDPETDITVTVGATEAIFASIMTLVTPGDEVIVFEPVYDSYLSSIRMAGGIPVPVTLQAPTFEFDPDDLKKAVTDKTKLIIMNNPHNPSGKVFSQEQLQQIAGVAVENDLYVISDEVYEFLVYQGKHTPIASLSGMQERTVTISSAGKTFGLTGWKIGWCCSSKKITEMIRSVHQYITFSVATPLQMAMADGLASLDKYIPDFIQLYDEKRKYFYEVLKGLGYDFTIPEGTYFMMVPIDKHTTKNDVDYCLELMEQKKVASIPPSAFYLKTNQGQKYLRFCYAKKQSTLEQAAANLKLL